MTKQLDAREARFVAEYLVDLDARRAALAAGYSPSMAQTKVFQWVSDGKTKPHVFAAIKQAMDKRAKRTEITADRVLRELGKIGFANLSDVVSWGQHEGGPFVTAVQSDDLPEPTRSAVSEVSLTKDGLKIKMHDKNAALVSLGRHLGMFKDKVEHSGELTVTTVIRKIVD